MPAPPKILEAVKKAKEVGGKRKFAQNIDLTVNLKEIDLTKPESRINLEVVLPHGTGKPKKVAVFAIGELARGAREAGADLVLGREDIEALGKNRKRAKRIVEEHHFFIAQADFMPLIGKSLGPVLGPRGKMPKPVPPTANLKPLVERCRRTVRVRAREQPTIHVPIGVENMADEQLAENISAVLDAVEGKLEKGKRQIKSVQIKTTMGKPVKIE
jgi:large subunit ribosomal protein L1